MSGQNRWLLVFILSVVLFVGALGAHAQAVTWYVASLNTIGCANGATSFTTTVAGITVFPTTLRFRTIVDAGGLRYMDEDAGTPGSNGTYGWSLYNSSSGGPTTATFPIPPDTQIRVQFLLIDGVGGPTVSAWEVVLSQCNGGTMIYNGPLGGFPPPTPTASGTPGPTPTLGAPVPVTIAGCRLPIPEGSVVGEAPFGAQVYYEPGNVSPGVVLNPGTYHVIGQDATETYYKIFFNCQYLWVLKNLMQPSYLPPQNGAPLPQRIVS